MRALRLLRFNVQYWKMNHWILVLVLERRKLCDQSTTFRHRIGCMFRSTWSPHWSLCSYMRIVVVFRSVSISTGEEIKSIIGYDFSRLKGMNDESVPLSDETSENAPTTDVNMATTDASTDPFDFRSISDQEKIRVSVHNFTRPLRKRGRKLPSYSDNNSSTVDDANDNNFIPQTCYVPTAAFQLLSSWSLIRLSIHGSENFIV